MRARDGKLPFVWGVTHPFVVETSGILMFCGISNTNNTYHIFEVILIMLIPCNSKGSWNKTMHEYPPLVLSCSGSGVDVADWRDLWPAQELLDVGAFLEDWLWYLRKHCGEPRISGCGGLIVALEDGGQGRAGAPVVLNSLIYVTENSSSCTISGLETINMDNIRIRFKEIDIMVCPSFLIASI